MARNPKQSASEADGVPYRRANTWEIAFSQMNNGSAMIFYVLVGLMSYLQNAGYGIAVAAAGLILTLTRVFDGLIDPLLALMIEKVRLPVRQAALLHARWLGDPIPCDPAAVRLGPRQRARCRVLHRDLRRLHHRFLDERHRRADDRSGAHQRPSPAAHRAGVGHRLRVLHARDVHDPLDGGLPAAPRQPVHGRDAQRDRGHVRGLLVGLPDPRLRRRVTRRQARELRPPLARPRKVDVSMRDMWGVLPRTVRSSAT